ncbi:putative zinc finger protein 598 [Sciurus carolinensis]|uniref:Zinc finger protein 598 n=1 Tax=Sciurus carolinensis TaxID=30640 RepID=A0AA41MUA9_SCICA|nr:putative zinc finger protein 598 [Sciurus carolinensis]
MPTGTTAFLLGPASTQASTNVGKKKKVGSEKPGTTLFLQLPSDHTPNPWTEQAPEAPGTPPPTPPGLAPPVSKTPPNTGFYSLLSSHHPACIPSATNTTTTTTTTSSTKSPMLTSTP